jgi:uncharacterized protein YjhX (UPF0386 family)
VGGEVAPVKSTEARMLRFLSVAGEQDGWISYRTILNTDDLLPGDERALAMLMWRGLVEENAGKGAYRLTEAGHKAVRSRKDAA